MTRTPEAAAAIAHCLRIAQSHYENFPVASRLLPRTMREPVAVIYAFARGADDFADEGDATVPKRLAQLDGWATMLDAAAAGMPPEHPVFIALAAVIHERALPVPLLHDLIEAFRMDVRQRRWPDYASILDYCRHSANPIGRLLLHLDGSASDANLADSDRICTALQLINFWQDLGQDYTENDRIYLPQDEMRQFGVTDDDLARRPATAAVVALMEFQRMRTRAWMVEGAHLARNLRSRLGLEVALVVEGGLRILDKLDATPDPFARPRLGATDWAAMAWGALGARMRHHS